MAGTLELKSNGNVLQSFEMAYRKMGKHRKKCPRCGKLISDGDNVLAQKIRTEKYYPVKGIMGFVNWYFTHIDCAKRAGIA